MHKKYLHSTSSKIAHRVASAGENVSDITLQDVGNETGAMGAVSTRPYGGFFRNTESPSTILSSWDARHFTDPKSFQQQQELEPSKNAFEFIVHTTPLSHLINLEGVFSEQGEQALSDWDIISASVISDKKPYSYGSVGVILKVPPQNILIAHEEDMMSELNVGVPGRVDFLVRECHTGENKDGLMKLSSTERSGLLSKEVLNLSRAFSMKSRQDLLRGTYHNRNEVVIATKPGVNIHPALPATDKVEIIGFFMMTGELGNDAKKYSAFLGKSVHTTQERESIFVKRALPLAARKNIPALFIRGGPDVEQ
jgi:hypothetical protein